MTGAVVMLIGAVIGAMIGCLLALAEEHWL